LDAGAASREYTTRFLLLISQILNPATENLGSNQSVSLQTQSVADTKCLKPLTVYKLFGSRNELVHHLLTPYFFVWFVECIELIYHHSIPYSYLVSTNIRNKVIPPNLRNGSMMHHHILDGVICWVHASSPKVL
jgi:hypothetical protein